MITRMAGLDEAAAQSVNAGDLIGVSIGPPDLLVLGVGTDHGHRGLVADLLRGLAESLERGRS